MEVREGHTGLSFLFLLLMCCLWQGSTNGARVDPYPGTGQCIHLLLCLAADGIKNTTDTEFGITYEECSRRYPDCQLKVEELLKLGSSGDESQMFTCPSTICFWGKPISGYIYVFLLIIHVFPFPHPITATVVVVLSSSL